MIRCLDEKEIKSSEHHGREFDTARDTPDEDITRRRDTSILLSPHSADDLLSAMQRKVGMAIAVAKLDILRSIALELFDSAEFEFNQDPEIPDCQYIIVSVTASGDLKEISGRRQEWHRRVHSHLKNAHTNVRLIIDVA